MQEVNSRTVFENSKTHFIPMQVSLGLDWCGNGGGGVCGIVGMCDSGRGGLHRYRDEMKNRRLGIHENEVNVGQRGLYP